MKIEVKQLKEPFPYKQIADLLQRTYFEEYTEMGSLLWNEEYAKFYINVVMFKEESKKFIFGAFKNNKLIGTLFGHHDPIILDNEIQLETLNLGLLSVNPEYRRQGVAKALLTKLIDEAKKDKIDLLMGFPEKGRFGDNLLKQHFDFKYYGKAKHLLKLMEDTGLHVLREYYKVNPVIVKIATLYAHVPDLGEPEGIMRKGQIEDYPKATELINSYRSRVPLSMRYTQIGRQKPKDEFTPPKVGEPWNFYFWLLERNNQIIAALHNRIELATFKVEDGSLVNLPVALLARVAFHQDLEMDQKVKFINCILRKVRSEIPAAFATQICSCQHEMKVFRKLKFISDRSYYYLYMRPLTKKGEEINRHRRYKEYYLDYYR